MTVHLVTFSDESMSRARNLCITSAVAHGVNDVIQWQATPCKGRHPDVNYLMEVMPDTEYWARGFGYWKWKPAIIADALRLRPRVNDGDILIYSDAGVEFINNTRYIIDRMGHEKPQDDVWLFGNNWEHAHWCKRDVIEAVWPQPRSTNEERLARIVELEQAGRTDILEAVDAILKGEVSEPVLHDILWNQFGKQCQASVIFFRVSDYTRSFVKEWLDWCLFEGGRLIDDSPSRLPNHPEFREHRHDQAILTTMAYREGIKLHYWPAVYNKGGSPEFFYEKLPGYARDTYPAPLFSHNRKRNHEWSNAA